MGKNKVKNTYSYKMVAVVMSECAWMCTSKCMWMGALNAC
jgi:hypothetical protein